MKAQHAVLLLWMFLAFIPQEYHCAKQNIQESKSMDEELDSMIDVSSRKRRNIIDNARDTVRSTSDKLRWIKKNFRYLFLMVASGFVLFFSCAVYRRCTRDSNESDDGIQVVVVGGPQKHYTNINTPPPPPQEPPARPPPPKQSKPKKPSQSKPKLQSKKNTKKTASRSKKGKTRDASCYDSDEGSISADSSEPLLETCTKDNETEMGDEVENMDTESFRNLKDPLPREKIASRIVHEGIPLSCFMSYQQLTDMGSNASYLASYLNELRVHAVQLHAEDTALVGNTSMDLWPIVDDIYMNDHLSVSLHERRGQFYPTASPDSYLPITAAVN